MTRKPERRHGHEVARQTHDHGADGERDQRHEQASDEGRDDPPDGDRSEHLVEVQAGEPARQVRQQRRLLLKAQGQDGRDVDTQGHEPDLAQREQASEATHQVEADREHHVDGEHDRLALPDRASRSPGPDRAPR